jgi:hypothetical protein
MLRSGSVGNKLGRMAYTTSGWTLRVRSDATYGLNTANYQKRFSKLPNFRCGEALEMGSSQVGRDLLLDFSSSLSYFIDFSPPKALMRSGIRTHPYCINKANSAELSEALNSMFRWYCNAAKCYVFLSDISAHKRNNNN